MAKTWRRAYGASSAGALIGAVVFFGFSALPGFLVFGLLDAEILTPEFLPDVVSTAFWWVAFVATLSWAGFLLSLRFRQSVLGRTYLVETVPEAITLASAIFGTRTIRYCDITSAELKTHRRLGVGHSEFRIHTAGRAPAMRIGADALRDPAYFDEIVAAVHQDRKAARG